MLVCLNINPFLLFQTFPPLPKDPPKEIRKEAIEQVHKETFEAIQKLKKPLTVKDIVTTALNNEKISNADQNS